MKKRILAAILSAALAALSIFSVPAATDDNASNRTYNYITMGSVNIPDDYAGIFITGNNIDPETGIRFNDSNDQESETIYFDFASGSKMLYLPNTDGYVYMQLFKNISATWNKNSNIVFAGNGGEYERIRINLSDFTDDFNSDGTFTTWTRSSWTPMEYHDFNFTNESDGVYRSSLIFISGNAVTGVVPNASNGTAEFYVSTKLGVRTEYMVDCRYTVTVDGKKHYGSAGGALSTILSGLTIGDVDKNGFVQLADAILIQKYVLKPTGFDRLSRRNADVDRNGNINLLDAIKVQKYTLGLK